MSRRVQSAMAACAITYLIIVATLALGVASSKAFHDPQLFGSLAQAIIPPMAIAIAGALIASRVPRLGWTLLGASLISALSGLFLVYEVHTLITNPGSLPGVEWVAWATPSGFLYPGAVVLIMLLFPDGRLPSRGWRLLVVVDIVFVLLNFLVGALDPTAIQAAGLPPVNNPTALAIFKGLEVGPLGWVTFLGAIPLVLAGVSSLIVRLRRAQGEVRQQLRWVVYALAVSTCVKIVLTLSTLVIPPSARGLVVGNVIHNLVVTLGFGVALPAAMAIAILKYRLYDIDIVISRTLLYGSLAAFITLVYIGIVVGLGALIGSGSRPNLLLSIAATALVAVAFQPVRTRLETLANRLVYGYRATPYELLSQFSRRVSGAYADEEVLLRIARVLVEGTGALAASVWLQGLDRAAATWPASEVAVPPDRADRVAVVRHQGEFLGELTVRKRSGEPLTPVENELVDDLAAQAGQVLRNVRLTSELQGRVAEVLSQSVELQASRQRLVAAQAAERRRLERNIHDGAQQHLVALAVKLRLAASLAKKDKEKARRSISELHAQTADALTTLHDLGQGIYPPILRERGLIEALRERSVVVTASGIGRYEPEVEAAVYFSCLEALQNASKYAHATQLTIDLQQEAGELRFRVRDNGVGFDPETIVAGSGIQNMQDRIGSLGGRVMLRSSPGEGTTVSGTIPLTLHVMAEAI